MEWDENENRIEAEPEEEEKISKYTEQRRMQQRKMQREVRHSQKRLKKLRVFARFIIIVGLIYIGYRIINMQSWIMDPTAFDTINNPSLEIINNKIIPSNKILMALRQNDVPRVPLFMYDTQPIKNSILHLEPVKDVYVRRYWRPARLQIQITERIPAISISPDIKAPPVAFFSEDGKLIGREYMPLPKEYKTIMVLSYGLHGDDYRNWDDKKVNMIKDLAKAIEVNSNEQIEYIDFRNPNDVYVKIPTTLIRLGEVNEDRFPYVITRIQQIPSILPQVKKMDKKVKYINLKWNTNYIKLDSNQGKND